MIFIVTVHDTRMIILFPSESSWYDTLVDLVEILGFTGGTGDCLTGVELKFLSCGWVE